jgi:hypothetical protein
MNNKLCKPCQKWKRTGRQCSWMLGECDCPVCQGLCECDCFLCGMLPCACKPGTALKNIKKLVKKLESM